MTVKKTGGKAPNGSGSIWKRPDGRYGAALTYPYYDAETGRTKTKRLSTTKKDWDSAHRWLLNMQNDLLGGVVRSPEDPRVGDFLKEWLADVIEPSKARNTYLKREYNVRVHLLPDLGHVRLSGLTPRRIQALYSRLAKREPPLAATTRREVHVTLKMALKQAVRWGMLSKNPADDVDAPKQSGSRDETDEDEGEVRAISNEQARTLFASTALTGDRWRHYYVAAIRTGLRPGELLGLRFGDLALDTNPGSLKVRRSLDTRGGARFNKPKSEASRRTLALHWEAVEALSSQKGMLEAEGLPTGAKDLVFPSATGTPMDNGNLRDRYLKPALRRADLPELTLHELRHTFASIMLHEWRVQPDIVREMLGHESIKLTMDLYGHLFPGSQQAAILALRELHDRPEKIDVAV